MAAARGGGTEREGMALQYAIRHLLGVGPLSGTAAEQKTIQRWNTDILVGQE